MSVNCEYCDKYDVLENRGDLNPYLIRQQLGGLVCSCCIKVDSENVNIENGVMCGDCCKEIMPGSSCVHLVVDENGNSKIIG